jgi:hypothetical protein
MAARNRVIPMMVSGLSCQVFKATAADIDRSTVSPSCLPSRSAKPKPSLHTDRLGRRSGPRRKYTIAGKRSMGEETRAHGASVPDVALRHGANANLL